MANVLRMTCGEPLVDGDETAGLEMTAARIVGVEHVAGSRIHGSGLRRPRSVAAEHEVLDAGRLGRPETHADAVPLLLLLASTLNDGERHDSRRASPFCQGGVSVLSPLIPLPDRDEVDEDIGN